jgi:hypothetical protein
MVQAQGLPRRITGCLLCKCTLSGWFLLTKLVHQRTTLGSRLQLTMFTLEIRRIGNEKRAWETRSFLEPTIHDVTAAIRCG